MKNRKIATALLLTGAAAVLFSLPAIGQQGPESLLPEGFGDPPPPPASPPPTRPPGAQPGTPGEQGVIRPVPVSPDTGDEEDEEDDEEDKEGDEEEEAQELRYDVPPAARRSLSAVGIISESFGGYPANAFGVTKGEFLTQVLQRTTGPLASRWATIMGRRLLASRTDTPTGVDGADWTAERAWLLLRSGDAVTSRQLVQAVDAGRYTKRLHQVAMQAYLANGDMAGLCPLSESGVRLVNDGRWKMTRSICASLAGEQGSATAFLNQGRFQGWVQGVDYRLTEKLVGAGINGRRSVRIEWDKVEGMNPWRFGTSAAVGLDPPDRLFENSGRQLAGWRVYLPMFTAAIRAKYAYRAAGLGVLSNRAMVDLYGQVLDDNDAPDDLRTRAENLASAYTADGGAAKIDAMNELWGTSNTGADYQGALVMTARSAALIAPSSDHEAAADRLIASMFTAGFDRSAAAWANVVDDGSLGWALIAVGAPGRGQIVEYGPLNDFRGSDSSTNAHKSALLLAGLAGMGRIDAEALTDFAGDLAVDVRRQSAWSRAITAAAERGESGTVSLLALTALQAPDWTGVPAHHLYHIVRSLRQVGLVAEARMIAAEAVTFG